LVRVAVVMAGAGVETTFRTCDDPDCCTDVEASRTCGDPNWCAGVEGLGVCDGSAWWERTPNPNESDELEMKVVFASLKMGCLLRSGVVVSGELPFSSGFTLKENAKSLAGAETPLRNDVVGAAMLGSYDVDKMELSFRA
jgi:hypothetical protein